MFRTSINKLKKLFTNDFYRKKNWVIADHKYFRGLFKYHRNINSISCERGLTLGEFKGTSYLLKITPSNLIETSVYLNGIWEPYIAKILSSYLNGENKIVIDVGANIGANTIPLAKHFPKVQFHLFEPHPFIFSELKDNISINKLQNITAKNLAITNSPEATLPFYAQKNALNFGLSSFHLNYDIGEYDKINVNCASLDSQFSNKNFPVSIIKIDTQGHELSVLASGEKIIRRDRPVILFEFESEYFSSLTEETSTKNKIRDFFSSISYELFMVDRHSNFMPQVTLNNYFHGDIIAVPLRKDNT